ncbi:hypothetical protein O181_025955 [Austropuccinia psidii MF-1]|uniref:Reverse transcriptase domain-containing protein n=1 Tax=Austropuccinia psidii MF-1 TaxID=1389203 RepID=A0A9Q3CNK6_9BASI|nr:hypothetical protein [Austropuccinia psidii MF-1]
MLRKNRPAFAIGEEPLGNLKGHDIGLYLDVERPYPPMLRRPPYPESLQTQKEIEKHINELLDMDVTRKIGHNEIVEITTPVLITWHDGKSRLCGDFRALNNYTKSDRYPIPRIPHTLDKLAKAKYITKMDCMKGFHQNGVKPNSPNLLRIICHRGIYEYTRMPFSIKNAPAHFQRRMETIFQEEILEVWMVVYIDDIIIYSETWEYHVQYIDRVLNRKKNFRFSKWAPESGTSDSGNTNSEGTETPILGIVSSDLHTEFFNEVMKKYAKHKQCGILLNFLKQKYRSQELKSQLEEPWLRDYKDKKFFLIDGLLYHREKHTSALTRIESNHISFILKEFHACPYMGHMCEDRTKERVARTALWPSWEQELSEDINTCERCQKENSKMGRIKLTDKFSRKHRVFPVSLVKPYFQAEEDEFPSRKKNSTPPEIVEVEDHPGPVKKIIKARKIRLNGKDQRQYLVRFKNQTADKDKWLAEDAIPDENLHLRRFRTSRRTEQYNQ